MRRFINIIENAQQDFVSYVETNKPSGSITDLQIQEDGVVFVGYIEGRKTGMVPFLCRAADRFGITLTLLVDVYSSYDGGNLVPYYQQHGFEIVGSSSGEAFNKDGEFYLSDTFEHDEIEMIRKPE